MDENQNIEFKESWRDDYLKWICGFANANGGTIFIGKNDNGKVVGVKNQKKLMEDIPSKIRNYLGIIADVNLHNDGASFLEIIVPSYSVPVSYQGRYYYRSGSTKVELTGNALNEFLLKKSGKTWDDVIEQDATLDDIDFDSISHFLSDVEKSGRIQISKAEPVHTLLENLRLTDKGYIKRAGIVLFGNDPGRFYPNQKVKIGRFGVDDSDLKFQDVLEGNLISLLFEVPDILNRKYFNNPVDFEGLLRIEKGEYPVAAIREMLLNAVIHRDYLGTVVQLRIYDDKIAIWNDGGLPEGISLDSLKTLHPSKPRNPIIADVCFKGGYIDAWGRGILKIINSCKQAELPEPDLTESNGGFMVTLFKDRFIEPLLRKIGLNQRQIKAVLYVRENGKITNSEYQKLCNISDRTALRELVGLTQNGILKKTGKKRSTIYKLYHGGYGG